MLAQGLSLNHNTFNSFKLERYLISEMLSISFFLRYNSLSFWQLTISFRVDILFTERDKTSKFIIIFSTFKSSISYPHKFKFLIRPSESCLVFNFISSSVSGLPIDINFVTFLTFVSTLFVLSPFYFLSKFWVNCLFVFFQIQDIQYSQFLRVREVVIWYLINLWDNELEKKI